MTEESEIQARQTERMRGMSGIRDGGLIKPNREMDDSRVGVSTTIREITFPLNVLKWSRLEIEGRFSAKSNYVLIAPVTDIELRPAEVTDVRTAYGNTTRRYVNKQPKQPTEDF